MRKQFFLYDLTYTADNHELNNNTVAFYLHHFDDAKSIDIIIVRKTTVAVTFHAFARGHYESWQA